MTRAAAWLAGLWTGALLCIAGIAAPSAFAVLARADAGRVVARLFAQEAALSLVLALLLFMMERRRRRDVPITGAGSVLTTNILLLLGTLFCTIAGYFAIQPMLADARVGHGTWSFAELHAVSLVFYAVKTLLVAVLAWRLTSR